MSLEGIAARAWATGEVPGRRPAGTMAIEAERRLLYYLASEYFADEGHIVDAGCLLGGSTLAFGYGLQAWQARTGRLLRHRIHAYDRFIAEPWMFEQQHLSSEYRPGQSLLPKFTELTAPVGALVTVHEGDIAGLGRPEGPIELLFVDVAKTPALSDYIVREFFPALIPGRSIVVQQDYLYDFEAAGWLHVTMEHYAEHFRILTDTMQNSVAFLYERAIPPERLMPHTLERLGAVDKIALMAKARTRFSGVQADMMARAHLEYMASTHWEGSDPAAHRAVQEAARYLREARPRTGREIALRRRADALVRRAGEHLRAARQALGLIGAPR